MAIDSDLSLTGANFELVNAGYTPMPDADDTPEREAIGSDSASLREAAEQRSPTTDDVTVRRYLGPEGKPAAANEAITLDRAGRDYAIASAPDRLAAENAASEASAQRTDAVRAKTMERHPDAAYVDGLESPELQAGEAEASAPGDASQDSSDPSDGESPRGLDAELERALRHPQVVQAIEEQIGETERTRQGYLNGLAAATQIAQVAFLHQFPELAGIPARQLPGALEQMSRQDPQKLAHIQAMIATTQQLFAQQQHESRRQGEIARQHFDNYAQHEDARFEDMLKGESKATQQAVTAEIIASARESGVEPDQLFRMFDSEPLMRNAAFQKMMYDAGKFRLMMKAKAAAAARPLPPVQRPGTGRTPAERDHADFRSLDARLSHSGDLKDAVALYHARKSSRG